MKLWPRGSELPEISLIVQLSRVWWWFWEMPVLEPESKKLSSRCIGIGNGVCWCLLGDTKAEGLHINHLINDTAGFYIWKPPQNKTKKREISPVWMSPRKHSVITCLQLVLLWEIYCRRGSYFFLYIYFFPPSVLLSLLHTLQRVSSLLF